MHALQFNRQPTTTSSALHDRHNGTRNETRDGTRDGTTWRWLPLALALVGWSATTHAAEYAIQVGAFKSPSQSYAENLRSYGEVNSSQSSSGATVFTVGRYSSVDEAKGDLNRIASDYPGAFVRNLPSSASSSGNVSNNRQLASQKAAPRKAATPQSRQTPDTQLWESLSESERRRVVYLDGVLHLKQGDQFVPLAEYRRSQAQ